RLGEPEPEAHEGAALDLAFDERGVDSTADVVDLHELQNHDFARLVVALHLGDAGRVRDRRVRLDLDLTGRIVDRRVRLQRGRGAADQLAVVVGRGAGDVRDADRLLRRALRADLA